ncbi:MAG: polysaccharide deacetylase family protein [Candidatus Omnitrophica bacterium]|nr:polysaccharide deacetylase family protein [Candidatus Omnitrophota bacterium]
MRIPGFRTFNRIKNYLGNQGLILMYHRVVDLKSDPWSLCVSPERFEEQMQVIKRYTQPVSIDEIGTNKNRLSSLSKIKISITFDDGYSDNFKFAQPILNKYDIPATFFITTGAINSKEEFWWDEIGRLILENMRLPNTLEINISGIKYSWQIDSSLIENKDIFQISNIKIPPNNSTISRLKLHYVLWKILIPLSMNEKKTILESLRIWSTKPKETRSDYLALNSKELESLANSKLFRIGAHTVRHPMLSRLTIKEQEQEISESKFFLENLLNIPIRNFAYPHGDFSSETISILKRLDFTDACTVNAKLVNQHDDRYMLPRFAVLNWNGQDFEYKLNEWFTQS